MIMVVVIMIVLIIIIIMIIIIINTAKSSNKPTHTCPPLPRHVKHLASPSAAITVVALEQPPQQDPLMTYNHRNDSLGLCTTTATTALVDVQPPQRQHSSCSVAQEQATPVCAPLLLAQCDSNHT